MASVLTTPSFSLLCTRGEEDELPNLQPGQSSAVLWWFPSHWHPHSNVVNLISFGFLFWRPIYCWYPRPCYRTESHTQEHIPCHQMQVSTWGSWGWISREPLAGWEVSAPGSTIVICGPQIVLFSEIPVASMIGLCFDTVSRYFSAGGPESVTVYTDIHSSS